MPANLKMLFYHTHASLSRTPTASIAPPLPARHTASHNTSQDALRRRHPEAPPGDLLVQPRRLQRRREGARAQEDGKVAKEGQSYLFFSLLGIGGHFGFFICPLLRKSGLIVTFFETAFFCKERKSEI